ncbi:MAG: response regulator transcription factor [bacterium]|nr:response regulator transcription factor [bacterium]
MLFNLTAREIDVLQLLKEGFNNTEISKKLFISTHTVKAHLENIYEKLNVHNRVQAVVFAIQKGII